MINAAQPIIDVKEITAQHVTPDTQKRITQKMNFADIDKGSQIRDSSVQFSLDASIGEKCIIILNEPHLNPTPISDEFVCSQTNDIKLNKIGNDALQTKLHDGMLKFLVVKSGSKTIIPIKSDSIFMDVKYELPSYYAKIENGKVAQVIVADQDFVATQLGIWIQTFPNTPDNNFAGIGDQYDINTGYFIKPKPFNSWVLQAHKWVAPIPYPNDGNEYYWDEVSTKWVRAN